MFPYDAALLSATPAPARTIPEVLAGMLAMDALFADDDGLGWFHWLYLQVTQSVAARVATGGFSNLEWLAELDVQFANLYFSALHGHLTGQKVAACWRTLFERRTQPLVARIQFAIAGINAHINHDLPIALVATCKAAGVRLAHGSAQYADYTAVNPTLDALVNTAKSELRVRLLGDALPPVSHLEDTLAAWSVAAAREAAWTNGEILWALRRLPLLTTRHLKTLDGITTLAGKTLLVPVPLP